MSDTIACCPECESPSRYHRRVNSDDHDHRYACYACGATFNELGHKDRGRGHNSGLSGLSLALAEMDADGTLQTNE